MVVGFNFLWLFCRGGQEELLHELLVRLKVDYEAAGGHKEHYQSGRSPLKLVIREAVVVNGEEREQDHDSVDSAFEKGTGYDGQDGSTGNFQSSKNPAVPF